MSLTPVNLTGADGLNKGPLSEGVGVRHVSPSDALDASTFSNPTRQLAERDNVLAGKLNEVISRLNNTEQYAPVPLIRITLSPGQQITVTNFRIPPGQQARIVNAAVGSTVPNTGRLDIEYNATGTFGGSTGEVIVSTSTEFTGGTDYVPEGEFIFKITNAGVQVTDITASVLIALRSNASFGTVVGAPVKGQKGDKGIKGDKGSDGTSIKGDPGDPGLTFIGEWNTSDIYYENDVVTYEAVAGEGLSAFVAIQTVPANNPPPDPEIAYSNAYWKALVTARKGDQGVKGDSGERGLQGYSGASIVGPPGTNTAGLSTEAFQAYQSAVLSRASVVLSGSSYLLMTPPTRLRTTSIELSGSWGVRQVVLSTAGRQSGDIHKLRTGEAEYSETVYVYNETTSVAPVDRFRTIDAVGSYLQLERDHYVEAYPSVAATLAVTGLRIESAFVGKRANLIRIRIRQGVVVGLPSVSVNGYDIDIIYEAGTHTTNDLDTAITGSAAASALISTTLITQGGAADIVTTGGAWIPLSGGDSGSFYGEYVYNGAWEKNVEVYS